MNSTKAKQRLSSRVEKEYSLEYEDGTPVSEGDEVFVYGDRRKTEEGVKWRVQKIFDTNRDVEISDQIEKAPEKQQLILKGTIGPSESITGDYSLSNAEIHQSSSVEKCKDKIKEKLIQMFRIGFPNRYMAEDVLVDVRESLLVNSGLEPLGEDDLKITTKRTGAMHFGPAGRKQDHHYKAGVNWSWWHRATPTKRLRTLSHELVHTIHSHHKKPFFITHAKLVSRFAEDTYRKARIDNLFEGDINWNKLKALTLDGVHSQSEDIDIAGHSHRRSACNEVVEEMEEILNYQYEVGRTFHLHVPINEIYPRWILDDSSYDPDASREDIAPPAVEYRTLESLEFDDSYSDEELYEYFQDKLAEEKDNGITRFVYDIEDLPVVENGVVVSREKTASLFSRMINETDVITQSGFSSDHEFPVFMG